MFFTDSTGFFSLLCLFIQCGLAWIFFAFFCVLPSRDAPWLRCWRLSLGGLGIALLAVSSRFLLAHQHVAGLETLAEGALATRLLYGAYLGGKAMFVWFLAAGMALLRRRAWPASRWLSTGVAAAAFVSGACLPVVESVLLFQAPWVAAGFGYAAFCMRRDPGEVPHVGRRVAMVVLATWTLAWIVYGVSAALVWLGGAAQDSFWNLVLRCNSLLDLLLQVTLASALIVLVMHDAQQTALLALQDRDRLRERVQRDERLRTLSMLVGSVTHELNNPLTSILGFAEDLVSGDVEVRTKAARIVHEQAERCARIVQRVSRIGERQERLEPHPVEVAAVCERVAQGFQPMLARAGVTLALELEREPCRMEVDSVGIEQVLTNLIANAVQASPRGGRVLVRTRHAGADLHIEVLDNGPGVPPADRARIFEPYWTSKKVGQGTGLGLAVVQALVHANGGRIVVTDAPGGGALFDVVLPRQGAQAGPVSAARTPTARRLLVVDDDPAVRTTIVRQAERHGWSAVEAPSGERALELLLASGSEFDAVVCDLRMPGLSGMGLYEEVRRREPALLRRLLFLTGDMSSAEAIAFVARCNAPLFGKPFRFGDLLGRLREITGSA